MAALGDIIKINDDDYANLKAAGSAGYVINGVRYYYDPNNIYLTPNNSGNIIALTWSQLKILRDNADLIPGTYYRITDYQCTTTETLTSSAGHQFDIIVRADSSNKLNEEASAIQHEGDTYFANSKLEVWRLWYCLDNDIGRFYWASPYSVTANSYLWFRASCRDKTGDSHPYAWIQGYMSIGSTPSVRYSDNEYPVRNEKLYSSSTGSSYYTITAVSSELGKGVIYRMIDEYNNDVGYDFKNILWDSFYTFDLNQGDASLVLSANQSLHDNKITSWIGKYDQGMHRLNRISCRLGTSVWTCDNNIFDSCNTIKIITSSMSHNSFKDASSITGIEGYVNLSYCVFNTTKLVDFVASSNTFNHAIFEWCQYLRFDSQTYYSYIYFHHCRPTGYRDVTIPYDNCDVYWENSSFCYRQYNVPVPDYSAPVTMTEVTSPSIGKPTGATNAHCYQVTQGDGILWFSTDNTANNSRHIYIYTGTGWTPFAYAYNGYGSPGGYQIRMKKGDWFAICGDGNANIAVNFCYFIPLR